MVAQADPSATARDAPFVQSRCGHRPACCSRPSTSIRSSRSASGPSPSKPASATASSAARLRGTGWRIPNYASLPHISVGGAIATATHGSGARNRSLAASVAALDLVCADGSLVHLARGGRGLRRSGRRARRARPRRTRDPRRRTRVRAAPAGVRAAALGDRRGEPRRAARPRLQHEPLHALDRARHRPGLGEVDRRRSTPVSARPLPTGHATRSPGPTRRTPPNSSARPARRRERLPHFRLGFTPSGGDELQSEYAVAREHAVDAVRALRPFGPILTPLLLTSEIRAVAADSLWLSPFHERDSVCFHFTWKPLGAKVHAVLPQIEAALAPFEPQAALGQGVRPSRPRRGTRDYRRFARSAPASTPSGSSATRSTLSSGCRRSVRVRAVAPGLAAIEPVDRLDVGRARARSRRSRSSRGSAPA